MTIERMNELIARWKKQKAEYNSRMDKKIADLERERDLELAAQTQRIFARHHLDPDELIRLKYASKQQLKKVLEFINEEIDEPDKKDTAKRNAEEDIKKDEEEVID